MTRKARKAVEGIIAATGKNPYQVAKMIGVNTGLLHRVMNGGRSPTVEKKLREAGYLQKNKQRFAIWLNTSDPMYAARMRTAWDKIAESHGMTREELFTAVISGRFCLKDKAQK